MNRMVAALVLGGGAGLGIRGLMGLRNTFRSKPKVDPISSVPVNVPIKLHNPKLDEDEDLSPAKFAAEKQAFETFRSTGDPAYWEMPAGLALGGAGLYGGWKLMDWIMDKRRKAQMGGDLDKAKKEYEAALKDQYSAAMMGKGASADPPEPTLDDVFDRLNEREKTAFTQNIRRTAGNVAHGGAGLYLTALLALTGGAGLGAYSWTKSRSKAKAMERAMRKRRQMRQAPQPIMAVPDYEDDEERGY